MEDINMVISEEGNRSFSLPSTKKAVPNTNSYFGFPSIGPQRFTIGAELEMIVLGMPEKTECYKSIAVGLKPLARDLGTDCLLPNYSSKPSYFQVKDEESIILDNVSDIALEVATPVLKDKDWTWVIPRMCQAINSVFKMAEAQVHFNFSTGLQVHIAVAGRPYTLPEVKRVAKAVLLFEKQMDKLHPKCRRLGNKWANENRSCEALVDLSDEDAIAKIDGTRDFNSFISIVNSWTHVGGNKYRTSRYFRYNYTSLRSYGTIEFRQAMGTLREEVILWWIKTIIKFVTAAVKTPDYLFTEWAREGIPPLVHKVYGISKPQGYMVEKVWRMKANSRRPKQMK